MRPITMYEANDGAIFHTSEAALLRDAVVSRYAETTRPLGPERKLETNDYVQHDPATVAKARASFLRAALSDRTNGREDCIRRAEAGETLAQTMIDRILDGDPESRVWSRFCCIDAEGREWQQPYFAINGNPAGQAVA